MTEKRGIHVLGIESSCDDTGVAIIRQDGHILSNCKHSPIKQHLELGGIIPVIAKEFHLLNIDKVANHAFRESKLESVARDIDAIAVATRPGLAFSLQIGLNYGRNLAKKYSKPLIPIHHMQAHALMPLLENRSIKFPFIALLLSGGHCLLAIAKRYNEFHLLGSSLDDAPGDVLDKIARRLKLRNFGPPHDRISGGAAIDLLARREGADRFRYFNTDTPMAQCNDCNFSFSGYLGQFEKVLPKIDSLMTEGSNSDILDELGHMSASIQRVFLVQIAKKLQRAIFFYRMFWRHQNKDAFATDNMTSHLGFGLRSLEEDEDQDKCIDVVVSGGVATNEYLVNGIKLACTKGMDTNNRVFAPSRELCSDNGLMIAWNAMLRYQDYLKRGCRNKDNRDIDESVITDVNQMNMLEVKPTSVIGLDLSDKVQNVGIKLSKLSHPEFRVK